MYKLDLGRLMPLTMRPTKLSSPVDDVSKNPLLPDQRKGAGNAESCRRGAGAGVGAEG